MCPSPKCSDEKVSKPAAIVSDQSSTSAIVDPVQNVIVITSPTQLIPSPMMNMINQVFANGGWTIRVIGTMDDPWFSAKDIALQLGYRQPERAISDNIKDDEFKAKLGDLLIKFKPGAGPGSRAIGISMKGNAKNSIYLNEAGVYALAFGSNLPSAVAFKSWVLKEVLPSIRKTGTYQLNAQVQSLKSEINNHLAVIDQTKQNLDDAISRADTADAKVADVSAQLNRLHIQNSGLIRGKKYEEPIESIYIVASRHYASQGIYKVGRTKSMTSRLGNHNTSRVVGDYHVVLAEFKVHNSTIMENYIHSKLKHLLIKGETEFFKAPYENLRAYVQACIDHDMSASAGANALVDARYTLEQREFKSEDWMVGIPADTFGSGYYQPGNATAGKISLTDMSEDVKREVVAEAITRFIKIEKNIDYSIHTDLDRAFEPKICIKWSDLFDIIKSRLHYGEGAKLTEQRSQWSDTFGEIFHGAAGIHYVPYRPPKIVRGA